MSTWKNHTSGPATGRLALPAGGKKFVRTMQQLAERGMAPSVVSDQVGRLTFTRDLAEAIVHRRNADAPWREGR